MNLTKINAGFTLIELAMVLFIVALILGGVLTPLSTRLEQANRKAAEETMKEIRESLVGYALVNGHLPCPDCPSDAASGNCGGAGAAVSNDGFEDGLDVAASPTTSTNVFNPNRSVTLFKGGCVVQVGNVPWATLGVPEFDPWGRHYVYSVTQTSVPPPTGFADDNDGTNNAACSSRAGISFQLCSTGDMSIQDVNGVNVAQNVPAIILSYGANGQAYGGTAPASAAELENWWTDTDGTFISNDYISDQFDDIVTWITTPELMYRMVTAERLP